MISKFYSILLIVGAAAALQACSDSKAKNQTVKKTTEKIPVSILTLEKTQVHPVIQSSGLFSTDDETLLAFKTGGVIDKIFVKEGDAIRRGQLLATLNLTEIKAQVAQAELAHDKARRDFARVSNLYRDSVATLEQFQNAQTGLEVSARQLEAAKFNLSFSEIRAVNNGFVLRKLAQEGQVISSGTTVFQTNGAKSGKWILKAGVSDREWATISVGDPAIITTDALPGQTLTAKVTRKSETTDPATGSFVIELTLVKENNSLATGLFGRASIQASNAQQLWNIPYEALLDGDAQSGYVFITNDEQTVKKVPVTVSGIEKDHILVSAGLEQARALVVKGSAYLRDGSAITVVR